MAMYVYGCVWPCMTMFGYVGLRRAMYGYVWLCMAMYGYVWLCICISLVDNHPYMTGNIRFLGKP